MLLIRDSSEQTNSSKMPDAESDDEQSGPSWKYIITVDGCERAVPPKPPSVVLLQLLWRLLPTSVPLHPSKPKQVLPPLPQ